MAPKKPTNRRIYELSVSHSVYIERYKAGLIRRMMRPLDATERDVEEKLLSRLDRIVATGYDNGPVTTERILKLVENIGEIRAEAYDAVEDTLTSELKGLSRYESNWQKAMLSDTIAIEVGLTSPTAELLNAAVFSKPMNGRVLKEWTSKIGEADLGRIQQAITIGVSEGETVREITNRVIGTRDLNYSDGATEVTRRGAEALARTAVNHTVSQAREEVYKANDDIIKEVQWVSTLDGRTTLLCASRDGQRFALSDGPRPPAHWGCRSTTIPVIDGMALVANRPTVLSSQTRGDREIDFRESAREKAGTDWKGMSTRERQSAIGRERSAWAEENIGQVSAKTTYEDWFKEQPSSFQDELLGPSRGELYRSGDLTIERFIDNSGQMYTLDELREREADAFEKAEL